MGVKRSEAGCLAVLLGLSGPGCELEPAPRPSPARDTGSGGGVGTDAGPDVAEVPEDCVTGGEENALGVGRACDAERRDCDDATKAVFCSPDYAPRIPAATCTFPCSADDECGAEALCLPAGGAGITLCWPARCEEAVRSARQ